MRAIAIVSLVLVLVAPSLALAWGGGPGSAEPNTPQDRDGGYMFARAPAQGAEAIYFDVFPTAGDLTLDPNVAALGTRLLTPGPAQFRALLGVWADCNRDGYIGSAEGALQDYPATFVVDKVACPAGGWHNDGQWVSELFMIGMVDPCEFQDAAYRDAHCPGTPAFFRDTRVLYAPRARVWGDVGMPGEASTHCPLLPLPRGATSRAGALLGAIDCHDGGLARAALASDAPGALALLDAPMPVTPLGDPQTGDAGLLQRGSNDPAFTLWDCSQPRAMWLADPTGGAITGLSISDPTGGTLTGPQVLPIVGTRTIFPDDDGNPATPGRLRPVPTDAQGDLAWTPRLAPSLDDPQGSYWDAAELAADGPNGDCDPTTANALGQRDVAGAIEGDEAPGTPNQKARNDMTFTFYDGYRGLDSHVDPTLHTENFPSDLGLVYTRNQYGGPLWSSADTPIARPPLVRGDLSPEGPAWFTFYADFDVAGFSIPSAGATYGVEACSSIGAGVPEEHGWRCDPEQWWRDVGGADDMPRYSDGYARGAYVGDAFILRDVDCYDDAPAPSLASCP